jgi:hypothetical protein
MLSMLSLASDSKALQSAYAQHEEYEEYKKKHFDHVRRGPRNQSEMNYVEYIWFLSRRIDDYLESGLIKKTDEGLVVDEQMKGTLEDFVAFLQKKDLLPERNSFFVANRELAQSDGTVVSKQTEEAEQETGGDK